MARKPNAPLSDAQLEVMDIIWDQGETTVAEVWNELSRQRTVARNTVYTVMTRLTERGWLSSRRAGNRVLYSAREDRQSTVKHLVDRLVRTAFKGSAEGLVLTLLARRRLSPAEARRIRELISRAEDRKKKNAR